ncbi:unnamed protein product [Diatraea saccharalis]|uniref:Glucose-methanol-choline oxidoreductase N-terminal domain-containing protein n=1 Tax=Diatraea saccharalis TaxID=40085 RepID=A0A9N9RAI9_9NEOP|nr:unnamed protein product [Diatraea saccharalis]
MLWQPINLTQACPVNTHIEACSYFGYVYLNLLIRLYGDSEDRRTQKKLNFREQNDHTNKIVENLYHYENIFDDDERAEQYDFIVVGAGAAGCVVANRLSAKEEWKVLLLEAGPEQPDVTLVPGLSTALIGSNIDWDYSTEPNGKSCLARPGERCSWPRGKVMGGSSSINSMAYIRGNKVDYDEWAALGNPGWSYENVLPFFKKSEHNLNYEALNRKYHGVNGEQYVSRYPYIDDPSLMMTDAYNEAGLPLVDYNGAQQLGTMQAQSIVKDGERISTNNAFIQSIRYKRDNLIVKPNAEVIKILINDHKQAYGVIYVKNGKKISALAKKEVIVSGGTINSPKLLMLSGIGPKEHLRDLHIDLVQDLAVGENLQDHPTFNGYVIALPNKTATSASQTEILDQVDSFKYSDIKNGPLSGNGAVNSISFIKSDPYLPAPDIQFQADVTNWEEYIKEPTVVDSITIFPTSFYNAILPRTMNLVPKSRGKILLNSTNPYGSPLIYANYFGDSRDFIPIVRGVRFLLSLENTNAFKSRGAYFIRTPLEACKHLEWGTDDYTLCLAQSYTSSSYHPVGTCKMGPKSDRNAVVDPRLRVYGIHALRVIDASIMPVVPRGNTNAPSIMVGERGVAFVLEDWLGSH